MQLVRAHRLSLGRRPAVARRRRFGGRFNFALAIGALVAGSASTSCFAQADSTDRRIEILEQRLDDATSLIEALALEIERLKAEKAAAARTEPVPDPPRSDTADRLIAVEDRLDEVEQAVGDVETVTDDLEEKVGSRAVVHAFDAVELDLGGFYNVGITSVWGEDDSAVSVNRQTLELLLKAKLFDDWSLFAAQAFVREGDAVFKDPGARTSPGFNVKTGTETVLAWGNYRFSDALNIQAGRFVTPHGIVNIEHFPAILLNPEQPQFLRPFTGDTLFPNFTNGIQVHGRIYLHGGDDLLRYHLYTGSFSDHAEHFNFGGRLAYAPGSSGFDVGANLAYGQRVDGVTDYALFGGDVLYDKGPILWKTELFATAEDGSSNDRFAFYTQPAWRLDDRWTLFYRFDFLDSGRAPGMSLENAVGLSFRPHANIHLRSIYTYKTFLEDGGFPEADAHFLQGIGTVSF